MPASQSHIRPERVLSFQGKTDHEKLEQQRYRRAYLHYLVGWRKDEPWRQKYDLDKERMVEIEAEVRLLAAARKVREAAPLSPPSPRPAAGCLTHPSTPGDPNVAEERVPASAASRR